MITETNTEGQRERGKEEKKERTREGERDRSKETRKCTHFAVLWLINLENPSEVSNVH